MVAYQRLASEAFPSRPLVVEQNLHPHLALVAQAKQEAATGHTCSADNEIRKSVFFFAIIVLTQVHLKEKLDSEMS